MAFVLPTQAYPQHNSHTSSHRSSRSHSTRYPPSPSHRDPYERIESPPPFYRATHRSHTPHYHHHGRDDRHRNRTRSRRFESPSPPRRRKGKRVSTMVAVLFVAVVALVTLGAARKQRRGRRRERVVLSNREDYTRHRDVERDEESSVESWEIEDEDEDEDEDSLDGEEEVGEEPAVAAYILPGRDVEVDGFVTQAEVRRREASGSRAAEWVGSQDGVEDRIARRAGSHRRRVILQGAVAMPVIPEGNQPARGETSTGEDRDCIVCGEDKPATEYLHQITERCTHTVSTCRDCLGQWIRSSLQSQTWDQIRCAECPETCTYNDITRIAPLDIIDTIASHSVRTALAVIPDFHWCQSCPSGQIHLTGVEGPIFTCHACGARSCVTHAVPWHEGETCNDYTYRTNPRHRRMEERASERLVKQIAKTCPGPGCGVRIEKNAGCDHMTCRQCGFEFCWICRVSYEAVRRKGNAAHARSCLYHTRNVY